MNKKRFIPVGDTFVFGDIKLKVVATKRNTAVCTGCYFSSFVRRKLGLAEYSCYMHNLACTKHQREDGKHVIFKIVKEMKNEENVSGNGV